MTVGNLSEATTAEMEAWEAEDRFPCNYSSKWGQVSGRRNVRIALYDAGVEADCGGA